MGVVFWLCLPDGALSWIVGRRLTLLEWINGVRVCGMSAGKFK